MIIKKVQQCANRILSDMLKSAGQGIKYACPALFWVSPHFTSADINFPLTSHRGDFCLGEEF